MRASFLERIENDYIRPALRTLRPSRRVSYAGIAIKYRAELDGGGRDFGTGLYFILQGSRNAEAKASF